MAHPTDLKTFPIHPEDRHKLAAVPWAFVAQHERQAQHNHSQSLTRLAERGGLTFCELLAVVTDFDVPRKDRDNAEALIRSMLSPQEPAA